MAQEIIAMEVTKLIEEAYKTVFKGPGVVEALSDATSKEEIV